MLEQVRLYWVVKWIQYKIDAFPARKFGRWNKITISRNQYNLIDQMFICK